MRKLRPRKLKERAKGHTAGGRTGVQNEGDLIADEQRPYTVVPWQLSLKFDLSQW